MEAIKNRDRFTVPELSEELKIDPVYIHVFLNSQNFVTNNFKMKKIRSKGNAGQQINLYIRKGTIE